MSNKIYPFKFLDAYTAEDKDIFFGREEEVKQLYHMIYQSDTLLLYGASGTGKTSLIQCGLASQFQQHDWLEVFVRRHKNLNESLQKALLAVGGKGEESSSSEEDLAWLEDIMGGNGNSSSTSTLTPVQQYIKNIYFQHFRPIYLIFDQFEELFILGNKVEQAQFINTIQEILQVEQPVKLIFSIREEYLGSLYEFEKVIPQLLRKKLRIDPMNLEKVKAVVLGATTSPKSIVHIQEQEAEAIAEQVFEKIRGQENTLTIQLPYLQVFLDKFYRHISKDKAKVPTTAATFSLAALSELGSIGDILRDFLDEQIVEIANKQGCDHKTIWKILSPFVTVDGTKEPTSIDAIQQQLPHVSNSLIEQVVLALMNNRILRYIEEEDLYEVAHDSLALRIAEKRSDEEIALLEVKNLIKSQSLLKNEARELFSEKQLAFIAPFLDRIQLNPLEQQLLDESKAQVLKEQKEARRRKILLGFMILLVFIIITGFALYSLQQREQAEKATEQAYRDKEKAEIATQQAIKAKEQAVKAKDQAELAEQQAIMAQKAALVAKEKSRISEASALKAQKYSKRREQEAWVARASAEIAKQQAQEASILAETGKKNALIAEKEALEARENALMAFQEAQLANAKNEKIINAMDFYQGRLALAYHNGKYGFINKEGEPVIDYEYYKGEPFDTETGFAEMEYAVRDKTTGKVLSSTPYLVDTKGIRHRQIDLYGLFLDSKNKKAAAMKALLLKELNQDKEQLYLDFGSLDLQQTKLLLNLLSEHPDIQKRVGVLEIEIQDSKQLPPVITQLSNLTHFTLYSNSITSLPSSFTQLTQLTRLNLGGTAELTTLPNNIGQLQELRELVLPWDYGAIPPSLFDLKNLEVLDLGQPNISTLPKEIGQLQQLKKLTLYADIKELPEEFYQLKQLEYLELEVELSTFSPAIGQLKQLKILLLDAPLTALPKEFGILQQLQKLEFYKPKFESIPAVIGKNKQLIELYIDAPITTLPSELSHLKNLQTLTLVGSKLTSIPDHIGQLKSLKALTIYGPTPSIPSSIAQLKNLEELDLSENKIKTIPEEIGQLTKLKTLYLKGPFKKLPASINKLSKLTSLYLDNTVILQELPDLTPFPLLDVFHMNLLGDKKSAEYKKNYQTLKAYKQQMPTCTFKIYNEDYDNIF